ncbi:unnamed protein product [Didymodactylos carnosus]|uniref:Glycosyltransferase family 92 protein n=1 Tax=Didymodactylos carnosus TaxID=1234261 RepID=A0A814F1C6_9BILA|nr:unnamed protein product [Didymodactylos carnosus]CAF3751578.1 unnamed protein product [Didymodactylos carnosus]
MYLLSTFARTYPKLTILLILYLVCIAYFLSQQNNTDEEKKEFFEKQNKEILPSYKRPSLPIQSYSFYEPPSRTFQVPPFTVPYVLTHVWIPRELKIIVFVQGIDVVTNIGYCVVGHQTLKRILQQNYVYECLFQSHRQARSLDSQLVTLKTHEKILLPTLTKFRYSLPKPKPLTPKHFLCAVTQIVNKSLDLEDWLIYHKKLGIEYFFLYDNDSKDNTTDILKLPTFNEYVQMFYWPWIKSQKHAFVHAKLLTDSLCEWTLFFDVDEYIYVRQCSALNCLSKLLTNLTQNVGQICFKSKVFGSSGHIRRPVNGTVVDNYIHRSDARHIYEKHGKCAVKTHYAKLHSTIHEFIMDKRYHTTVLQPTVALLNHYKLKSWEDFMQKYFRRNNMPDWAIPANFSVNNPPLDWKFGHPKAYEFNLTTKDTAFRDFRKKFDKILL